MFISMGASWSKYSVEAQRYASHAKAGSSYQTREACSGLETARYRECIADQRQAQRDDQRAEYDLSAQRGMADAAWWMVFISAFTMLATVVGVWFVRETLRATLKAVEDTGEATEAMRVANRIAKRAIEQQLRPWVEVTVTDVRLSIINGAPRAVAILSLHNLGQSPALDIGYCFFMAIGEDPKTDIDETISLFRSKKLDWSDINLFHGSKYEATVSCEHTGDVVEGCPAFVFAIALYRTPFSNKLRYTARLFDLIDKRTGENTTFKGWPMNALFVAKPSRAFVGYAT